MQVDFKRIGSRDIMLSVELDMIPREGDIITIGTSDYKAQVINWYLRDGKRWVVIYLNGLRIG